MAIDKNSKAYQGLLADGYSDQQIMDMYNKVSSGQSRQEVVKNTTPINPAKSQATASNVDRSWDQGNGNYVYNSSTGYYEKEGTARATQTTPEVKQETPIKQQETVGSTAPEIKQEGALKPLSQDYYNQTGDDTQNKIRYNLNQYRQSNPGLFSTYEDFKKNFSYDARNDEQKQTLDAWYGEYQKGMEYGAIPTADLYTQYKDGSISTSDLEILRTYNPEKYAELQAQINKGNIIQAYDDTAPTEKQNFQDLAYQYASELFRRFMSGDGGSEASKFFDEYRANMDSPEMLELQDKQTDLIQQGKDIQDQIFSIQKDVEKEYEGTGATKSKINAIVADRTYDLQQQLRTINNEYEKYATQYNNRATQYQKEFQLQLQEYQVNIQARNQQMQELGFAMDLMNFETNEQKQQREWDYRVKQQEYTNGNINSKDYDTRHKAALKSVENLLAQYPGIPTQRSAEQMADDILKAIDNGSNLGAELTKINKFMQEKPEYKYLYNNTYGTSDKGIEGTYNIGGVEYVKYNGQLITSDEFNKKYGGAKDKANYNIVSEDALKYRSDGRANTYGSFMSNSKYDDGNYIGQCGKFVNDYLEEIGAGRLFGNEDINTREGWINSDEGKVGTIAVFDYNHNSSDGINHGHVGIVISSPDKNGDFWIKDANFDGDGKIQTRKVNLKDVSLEGFIDPSKNPDGSKGVAGTNTATLTSNSNGTTTTTSSISTNTDGTISLGVTRFSPAQFDDYVKRYIDGDVSYSEVKALGDDALGKVTVRALELMDSGYESPTQIKDPEKLASFDRSYEKQYTTAVADYNDIIDAVKKMQMEYDNLKGNESTNSQAIVYAFNKILDKGSVVREGEYARTANGQNLFNQVRGWVEKKFKGGQGITKSELGQILNLATGLSDIAQEDRLKEAQKYKSVIDKYGLTAEFILGNDIADELYNNLEEVDDLTIGMPLTGGTTGGGTITTTGGFGIPSDWNNAQ